MVHDELQRLVRARAVTDDAYAFRSNRVEHMASIDIIAAGISIERPDLREHASSDGTVAVLFSDIEGYTTMNECLGDVRTQELLRPHDTLVRDAVAAHGGTVVKSAGDGYVIVFSDANAAVTCAVALQRAHDAHDFGLDVGKIPVRMGSHVAGCSPELLPWVNPSRAGSPTRHLS